MRKLLIIFLLLPVTFIFAAEKGLFARRAVAIRVTGESTIASPDGKKVIVVRLPSNPDPDELNCIVSVRVNGKEFPTDIGYLVNAEILWSPDSAAFLVNYSDGGNIGTYHMKIFSVSSSGLDAVEPIPNGRSLFSPWCYSDEVPNVAGVRWLKESHSRMLIAIQVPPHSSCANVGTFHVFEISVPDGKVLNRYGQLKAKEVFRRSLGVELMAADDSCIRKPGSCVPPGLKRRR